MGFFSNGPIPLKIYKYNPKNWISWVLVCVVFFIIRAGFKLQWMNPPRGKTCKTIGPLKGIANIFHSGRPICFSIKSIETSVSKVSYYAVTMFLFFPLPSLFPPFPLFLSFSLLSPCCFPFFPPLFSSFFLSKTDCPMITAAHNGAQAGRSQGNKLKWRSNKLKRRQVNCSRTNNLKGSRIPLGV